MKKANDSIADTLADGEVDFIEADVARVVADLLLALRIDYTSDHNTIDTPARVAKMMVREVFAGRYFERPKITTFPNTKKLDELYTVGPITVRSYCAHHLCPIQGHAWIGVIPSEELIVGISKFARLTDWVMSRPQMQEEATVQLADEIESLIKPRGLGVRVTCSHGCMTFRGVRETDTVMTTDVVRGIIKDDPKARSEFLLMLNNQR